MVPPSWLLLVWMGHTIGRCTRLDLSVLGASCFVPPWNWWRTISVSRSTLSSFMGHFVPSSCQDNSSPRHLPVSVQSCNSWPCRQCQYGALACVLFPVIDCCHFFFFAFLSSLGGEPLEFYSICSLAVMTLLIWVCFFHFGRLRSAFSAGFSFLEMGAVLRTLLCWIF